MKNFIDQPYIEVISKTNRRMIPDRIYISIGLDELNSKNKTPIEQQERLLERTLKALNIDTEKDLSLQSLNSKHKSYFIKNNEIAKTKLYSLLVYEAQTAGKVVSELEKVGIANLSIEKTEYSKSEDLILELKCEAVEKAKTTAIKMSDLIGQEIGKAINIRELSSSIENRGFREERVLSREAISLSKSKSPDPIMIEFRKIKFEVELEVKFILL